MNAKPSMDLIAVSSPLMSIARGNKYLTYKFSSIDKNSSTLPKMLIVYFEFIKKFIFFLIISECSKFELTCANGQCVPREAFCNSHVDCADGSDETPHCTCADYLRLTAPDRLCNNVRDCLDKSDESSEMCECEGDRFKCSG